MTLRLDQLILQGNQIDGLINEMASLLNSMGFQEDRESRKDKASYKFEGLKGSVILGFFEQEQIFPRDKPDTYALMVSSVGLEDSDYEQLHNLLGTHKK